MNPQKNPRIPREVPPAIPAAARNMWTAPCRRLSFRFEDEWPVKTDATSDTSIAAPITRPIAASTKPRAPSAPSGVQ